MSRILPRRGLVKLGTAATFIALLAPGAAFARLTLLHSDPKMDARLANSPAKLTLSFSEPVQPAATDVEILDPSGKQLSTGQPQISSDGRVVVVNLPKLGPGKYIVMFHTAGEGSRPVQGRYPFFVGQ